MKQNADCENGRFSRLESFSDGFKDHIVCKNCFEQLQITNKYFMSSFNFQICRVNRRKLTYSGKCLQIQNDYAESMINKRSMTISNH